MSIQQSPRLLLRLLTITLFVSLLCSCQEKIQIQNEVNRGKQVLTWYQLTLQKNGTGSGLITGTGVNCGTDCNANLKQGTIIQLDAVADAGSTFISWGGPCSGTNSCTFALNDDTIVTAEFSSNSSLPQLSHLQGYYQMDELSWSGAGTTVLDSSSMAHHGFRNGNANTTNQGRVDRGGLFDGNGDFIQVPGGLVDTDQSYTIAAWVKPNLSNAWPCIASQDGNNISAFFLQIQGDGSYGITFAPADNTAGLIRLSSNVQATAQQWDHVAAVYDANSDIMKIFVNGTLRNSASGVVGWASQGDFIIGAGLYGAGNRNDNFDGTLDEVAIWNTALTNIELQTLYNSYITIPPGSYSFDSGHNLLKNGQSVAAVTTTVVGDFNGGGINDIAVLEGGKHAGGYKILSWYAGEEDFATEHRFNAGFNSLPFTGGAAAADMDGDGDLDLVFSEDKHSETPKEGNIWWFENPRPNNPATNENWTTHLIKHFDSNADVEHINDFFVADIDNDGKNDVIYRHLGSKSRLKISFQDSTPTQWTTITVMVNGNDFVHPREGLCVGNIDNDGHLDFVLNGFWLAGPNNPRTDPYLEFTIDSSFYSHTDTGLNNSSKCAIADYNGDLRNDVVITTAEGENGKVSIFKAGTNPRNGGWTETVLVNNGTGYHQAQFIDMNQDGLLDIFTGRAFNQTGIYTYLQDQNHNFSNNPFVVTTSQGIYFGIAADLDGDNDIDIAGPTQYASTFYYYKNQLY